MVRNRRPNPYANLKPEDWWHPDDRASHPDSQILTVELVDQFLNEGFIVLTGLWPATTIHQAAREVRELHPDETVATRGQGFSEMPWTRAGENAPDVALNIMSIHPRVLAAVAQLLNINAIDLRLSQSHIIAKFGQTTDNSEEISGDQDIHVDYGNNTLLVPPKTSGPEAVACLCYYSDVEECGGATHFVKAEPGELTQYSPSMFNPPNFVIGTSNGSAASETGPRSPGKTANRYLEEKPIYYKPGTCILYRLDAWHRGTPAALGKIRYTHHHVWRRKDCEWVNWQSLTPRMAAMPTRFMSNLGVVQRTVMGFAAPGDPYWTDETIDAVGQRYPEMDMSPYRQNASRSDSGQTK